MFKNTFQSGFLSILYSIGSKPLQIWDKKVRNGHIKRITDPDIQVSKTYEYVLKKKIITVQIFFMAWGSFAYIALFQSFVLEIVGTNVSTTYVTCPADPRKTLGIKVAIF